MHAHKDLMHAHKDLMNSSKDLMNSSRTSCTLTKTSWPHAHSWLLIPEHVCVCVCDLVNNRTPAHTSVVLPGSLSTHQPLSCLSLSELQCQADTCSCPCCEMRCCFDQWQTSELHVYSFRYHKKQFCKYSLYFCVWGLFDCSETWWAHVLTDSVDFFWLHFTFTSQVCVQSSTPVRWRQTNPLFGIFLKDTLIDWNFYHWSKYSSSSATLKWLIYPVQYFFQSMMEAVLAHSWKNCIWADLSSGEVVCNRKSQWVWSVSALLTVQLQFIVLFWLDLSSRQTTSADSNWADWFSVELCVCTEDKSRSRRLHGAVQKIRPLRRQCT